MALSQELITAFVKTTNDTANKNTVSTIIYGTVKKVNGSWYVMADGSEQLIPMTSTATVSDGDRVTMTIENHTATVTGNLTDQSASSSKYTELSGTVDDLNNTVIEMDNYIKLLNNIISIVDSELDVEESLIKIENGEVIIQGISINSLNDTVNTQDNTITAIQSDISILQSTIDTQNSTIETINSTISVYNSSFTIADGYVTGINGIDLNTLNTKVADIETAYIDAAYVDSLLVNYADIELANVDVESVGTLFAKVGILENVTIVDGYVTGTLNGVKINADVITAGTLSVDRLLVTGAGGIVYQINVESSGLSLTELSNEVYQKYLNGTDIVANSVTANQIAAGTITANEIAAGTITANKIDVADLFAQDITATGTITGANLIGAYIETTSGTIGGWTIGTNALYSGCSSISSNEIGTYIGTDGIKQTNSSNNNIYIEIKNGYMEGTAYDEMNERYITWNICEDEGQGLVFYDESLTIMAYYSPEECCVPSIICTSDMLAEKLQVGSTATLNSTLSVAGRIYAYNTIYLANNVPLGTYDSNGNGRTIAMLDDSNNYYFATAGVDNNVYIGSASNTATFAIRATGTVISYSHMLIRQSADLTTSNTGRAFQVQTTSSSSWESAGSDYSVFVCGVDSTSAYIRSYPTYTRTGSTAANVNITSAGVFNRYSSSAARYKNTINYFDNAEYASVEGLAKYESTVPESDFREDYRSILKFPVVQFHYNEGYMTGEPDYDYSKYVTGFIADDIAQICPACATYTEDGEIEAWNHMEMIPRMIACIQEQEKRITELENALLQASA